MNTDAKILARRLLKEHEGLRLKPYKCSAGRLTIGYDHNLDDNGISEQFAEQLLHDDIASIAEELGQFAWFNRLSVVRRAVLIDMAFNLGLPRFMQFKKMLAALQVGSYRKAAAEMLNSKWARQVGNRAKQLAVMMRTNNPYPLK